MEPAGQHKVSRCGLVPTGMFRSLKPLLLHGSVLVGPYRTAGESYTLTQREPVQTMQNPSVTSDPVKNAGVVLSSGQLQMNTCAPALDQREEP